MPDYNLLKQRALNSFLLRSKNLLQSIVDKDYAKIEECTQLRRAAFHNFCYYDQLSSHQPEIEQQLRLTWQELENLQSELTQHLAAASRDIYEQLLGIRKEKTRIRNFQSHQLSNTQRVIKEI